MSNYTPELEQIIVNRAEQNGGSLSYADVQDLAELPEFEKAEIGTRSLLAKINRMDVEYVKQVRTRKDGSAVMKKADVVAEIETALNLADDSLKGLEKATVESLRALHSAVA